jgi:hypothetical protein
MARILMTIAFLLVAVSGDAQSQAEDLLIPRGYYSQLELSHQGQRLSFGPFVGYYFKPQTGADMTRLDVLCLNERGFYTDQLPENAVLFHGEAVLATLPGLEMIPHGKQRITPVFFDEAPAAWREQRPKPQEQFVHFHSAYDSNGPVRTGYWLRHDAVTEFTYNMGGRLSKDSPLYHQARPGEGERFPRIIEFDAGPARSSDVH